MADPHQVARPIFGKDRAVVLDHLERQCLALAHPQAAEGVAIERHRGQALEAPPSLRATHAALVDSEQPHASRSFASQPVALGQTAPRPVERPVDRARHFGRTALEVDQLVERHGHVGSQPVLDSDRVLGRQQVLAPVQM